MKKVLIIKTGDTSPDLAGQCGDFEDWIADGLALDRENIAVADVRRGKRLPAWGRLAGVVVTGSHAMVTDNPAWSRRTQTWLADGVARKVPVLGICYGHQLLASALGGKVGDNPRGMEFGTAAVELNGAGWTDRLLGKLANPLSVQVCHTQSVLELPPGATPLAHSAGDRHQAFRVGDWAWGVQFHPEFSAQAMRFYIREYQQELTRQGLDPAQLLAQTQETPWGARILRRFAELTLRQGG
ncbi:MAG: glutamine amidotransferase [Desulfobacterales bacterium]|jgi:GMP synthase (glutamine-hydrolysing)